MMCSNNAFTCKECHKGRGKLASTQCSSKVSVESFTASGPCVGVANSAEFCLSDNLIDLEGVMYELYAIFVPSHAEILLSESGFPVYGGLSCCILYYIITTYCGLEQKHPSRLVKILIPSQAL